MKTKTTTQKILLVLFVLTVAINAISLFFLPADIYLQLNTNWDIHGSSVPNYIFVLFGPLVIAGAYYFAKRSPRDEKQALLLSAIAFIGSIVTIAFNMLSQ